MTLLVHYQMFGRYNAWANQRLYDAAARLGSEQYRADRGAFFKSVHGTLNHLLATDRVWMQRFTGTGTAPDRVDAILFETLDELRAQSNVDDANKVLQHVADTTPLHGYIFFPGKRGNGGYRTTIIA